MIKILYIILCLSFLTTILGQTKSILPGIYLFEDGLDSVNLIINKRGSYKIIEKSGCSGEDVIFYGKGNWKSIKDTVTFILDKRVKAIKDNPIKQKKLHSYSGKYEQSYFLKHDTLFLLNEQRQLRPDRFYCKTK